MPAKELTSTQRTINIILVAVLLVYGIVNIYLVVNAFSKLSANMDQVKDIIANFQSKTISDIQISNTANCPTGYETAFSDRYWAGVYDGCYCGSLVTQAQKDAKNVTCSPFCSSTCSSDALSIGCKAVAGKDKQQLKFVGSLLSNPSQICLKRTSESFASVGSVSKGSCPSGYTACKTGSTSTENVFCTKEAQCPVNGITIESTSTCAAGQTCIQLSDSPVMYVKYQRTANSLPLTQFTLNENGMCDIESQSDVTPNRKRFGLLKSKPTSCMNSGADKWGSAAIYVTEANLFSANGLTTYISGLTLYPDTANNMNGYYEGSNTGANYNYGLFNRPYVPWNIQCRDRISAFVAKKVSLDRSKTAQKALLAIGIISTFFLSIVLGFMEIQNLRGVDLSCIDGKGEEERTKLKRFKKWVNYGFKFLQIPFQIWAILLATGSKTFFAGVSADMCSSLEYNIALAKISDNFITTHKSNITALVILLATLLLDVILAAWDKRNSKKTDTNLVAITPSSPPQDINSSSARPLQFDQSSPISPAKPQNFEQPQQPPQTITIQLQQNPAPMQFAPTQQQYPQQQPAPMQFGQPQQQYPQQQAPMQFGQQQAPMQFGGQPQQQYPQQQAPMQFGQPQQQYPQQQAPMQFGQQQAPMQFGGQPQQQYPHY